MLSHSAGLPVVEGDFTLEQSLAWAPIVEQLARQAPRWEPGTAVGYHMRTYGWLTGELIRRVTGTTVGAFFRAEIGDPLGLDWWIGLPESEEPRVAPVIPPEPATDPEVRALMDAVMAPGTMLGDALTGPGRPLPLRRDVEHPRAARVRAAVVERHRVRRRRRADVRARW